MRLDKVSLCYELYVDSNRSVKALEEICAMIRLVEDLPSAVESEPFFKRELAISAEPYEHTKCTVYDYFKADNGEDYRRSRNYEIVDGSLREA